MVSHSCVRRTPTEIYLQVSAGTHGRGRPLRLVMEPKIIDEGVWHEIEVPTLISSDWLNHRFACTKGSLVTIMLTLPFPHDAAAANSSGSFRSPGVPASRKCACDQIDAARPTALKLAVLILGCVELRAPNARQVTYVTPRMGNFHRTKLHLYLYKEAMRIPFLVHACAVGIPDSCSLIRLTICSCVNLLR